MYKMFPMTDDGDQLMVDFQYQEELTAFKTAIHIIKQCMELDTGQTQFSFNAPGDITTLQLEVLRMKPKEAKKMLGRKVAALNFSSDRVYLGLFKK